MNNDRHLACWRAIEALRAGVPSRDVVRELGCSQPTIESRFLELLNAMKENPTGKSANDGVLFSGDFGKGKSHLLEYLQHVALANNFICSRVVISKDTPLYDAVKMYRAAIQSARAPDYIGPALEEVVQKLDCNSPRYVEFYKWVNSPGNGLSTLFAATVFIMEYASHNFPEIANRITRFWAGDPIGVKEMKDWLKDIRESATYKIDRASVKELAMQRYQFTPRLMVAAGYAGWIVLIDEVERIAEYSVKSRAKSYAQLARLLGSLEESRIQGLACIMAIIESYELAVLHERDDEGKILGKLGASGRDEDLLLASQAEKGMRKIRDIRKTSFILTAITNIEEVYEKVWSVYAQAYEWSPPNVFRQEPDKTIRQHIKRWINDWDLRRLYPDYEPEMEVTELKEDLSEKRGFEEESEEDTSEDIPTS